MRSESTGQGLDGLQERARRAFGRVFGAVPTLLVAAPGRVNLIGEHTDYNEGFVLPAAIDRNVVIAARPREDGKVRLFALDLDDRSEYSLSDIGHDPAHRWSHYHRGVAWALQSAGFTLKGYDAVFTSDVPIGAGLSSSAAVEVATAFVFQSLGDLALDGVQRALLCQKAENEFVGNRCGIMDQYISSLGKRDHALLIDCRSLDYELVPIPTGVSLVICDTNKRRGLVDTEYNTRRQECETGAKLLSVKSLRDVTPAMFATQEQALPEIIRKRCRHVVSEDQRTLDAVAALRVGDLARVGPLLNASHVSLRDDYQVSCAELDAMVAAAWKQPGVVGARMTGGGFGGCTFNLVRDEATEAFRQDVAAAYIKTTGLTPEIYVCRAEEGVRRLA